MPASVCRWIERADELSGVSRALGRLARPMEQGRIFAIERLIQTADRFPASLAIMLAEGLAGQFSVDRWVGAPPPQHGQNVEIAS